MKALFSVLTILLFGCKNSPKEKVKSQADSTIAVITKTGDSRDHTTDDSVIILSTDYDYTDTIIYSGKDFNEIVDYFPALYETIPEYPDSSYIKSGVFKEIIDTNGIKKNISFGSETGQDKYYILYAYFLQKQNTEKELDKRRETLKNIYNDINGFFDIINGGGTHFGHQFKRINAYVEYAVFQSKNEKVSINKSLEFSREKELYLSKLKNKIVKKLNSNYEYHEALIVKQQKNLLEYINHLDSLITNEYYLQRAQEFQKLYY